MSYMSEISIMIQDAAELGVTLELSDFRTLNGRLMIDGQDSNDWFDIMIQRYETEAFWAEVQQWSDRLEDREI